MQYLQLGREVLDEAAKVVRIGVTTDEIDNVVHKVGDDPIIIRIKLSWLLKMNDFFEKCYSSWFFTYFTWCLISIGMYRKRLLSITTELPWFPKVMLYVSIHALYWRVFLSYMYEGPSLIDLIFCIFWKYTNLLYFDFYFDTFIALLGNGLIQYLYYIYKLTSQQCLGSFSLICQCPPAQKCWKMN